jgi:hypothetical protein
MEGLKKITKNFSRTASLRVQILIQKLTKSKQECQPLDSHVLWTVGNLISECDNRCHSSPNTVFSAHGVCAVAVYTFGALIFKIGENSTLALSTQQFTFVYFMLYFPNCCTNCLRMVNFNLKFTDAISC